MSMKKWMAALLATTMLLSTCIIPSALADGAKWSSEATPDGWIKVTNEGGKTLGYSPDSGMALIEDDGYAFKDMNRNGTLDPYEDWRLDFDTRSQNLAQLMTGLDQAKMFMLLSLTGPETVKNLGADLTADLDHGIRTFSARASSIEDSVSVVNLMQAYAESLPFGIPVDLRGDRGNKLTSQWPQHLGLAASFDPDLVAEYNRLYSSELRDLGLTTLHHPQMDLATEPRWSRFTGTFGEHAVMDSDMGTAATNSLQSTYDENGNDLGWGEDSTNALIKHYPGDGQAEGGREAHSFVGKYNVYPGGMFDLAEGVYSEALTNLPGATGVAAGVMTDFSIHLDADGDPIGGDRVASAYSVYNQITLLRDKYNWDGIVCTDYSILQMMPWGMEDATIVERVVKTLEAGTDRIENYNVQEDILAGWEAYTEKHGKEAADQRLYESVRRLARSFMQIGLFENPYLSTEAAKANVASPDKVEAGYKAMLRSVIMLKNTDNIIHEATDAKPTVYIPVKADGKACIDIAAAGEYFNVITDTVSETNEVTRPSAEELAGVDFALVQISSPQNVTLTTGGMFGRPGYDEANDKWIPLSLQYRPYTADSLAVRTESIGGDMIEPDSTGLYQDDYYGQKAMKVKENRSYYGNTAVISNESDLDLVLDTAALVDKVIVIVNASNPFVVEEFENEVDALVMHFGADIRAVLDIVSGKVEPSALLPMQMPANMETVEEQLEDVPFDMECHVDANGNTYDFGFGLNWSGVIKDERTERYTTENWQ